MISPKPSGVLLTIDDISSIQMEYANLEKELNDLDLRRAELEERRTAAKERLTKINELLAALGIDGPIGDTATTSLAERDHSSIAGPSSEERPVGRGARVGWAEEIIKALESGPFQSLSFPEIRTAIMSGRLAENLRSSEKGYYNALSRLQKNGDVIREGSRLFLPKGIPAYHSAREKGNLESNFLETGRPSPIADAILAFVKDEGQYVTASSIIEFLKSDSRFSGPVGRNATAAYNVLARLVQRHQLVKEDGGYSLPETNEASTKAEASKNPSKAADQTGAD